ncbi:protein of unknown function (plasmid) [Xenorhabdus nematophila AN6/1]|nr:protein of unknown function [Xenorhabdus nematophila AN6/1]CEK25628.1 protein of unknown function [Xenorhabdus nematophila AN6/1]
MSTKNDGHYFPRTGGIPIDGLNEPLTIKDTDRSAKGHILPELPLMRQNPNMCLTNQTGFQG